VPVSVTRCSERIDRVDLPRAGPQDWDEQAAGGLNGHWYRLGLGVTVLGERIQQLPVASCIVRDTGLGDQLPSRVDQGDIVMLFRHREPLERPITKTATDPDARWLFPGRRAGQPMTPEALAPRLRHLGFPTRQVRTAAIRQLVLQAPAPVIARMLGYNDDHTTRIAEAAGGTWRHYAPGDHWR
jgi:hypothetical protein